MPAEIITAIVEHCETGADRRGVCYAGRRFVEPARIGMLRDISLSSARRMRSLAKALSERPALAGHINRLSFLLPVQDPIADAYELVDAVLAAAPLVPHVHTFGRIGAVLAGAAQHCRALRSLDLYTGGMGYLEDTRVWPNLYSVIEHNRLTLRIIRRGGGASWPGSIRIFETPLALPALRALDDDGMGGSALVEYLAVDAPALRRLDVQRLPRLGPGVAEKIVELEMTSITWRIADELERFIRLERLAFWGFDEDAFGCEAALLSRLPASLVAIRLHYGSLRLVDVVSEFLDDAAQPLALPHLARIDWRHDRFREDDYDDGGEDAETREEAAFARLETLCERRGIRLAVYGRELGSSCVLPA